MLAFPAALSAALAELDATLGPGPDGRAPLRQQLRTLEEHARAAVPSLLGLRLELTTTGAEPVALTALEPGRSPGDARSSVRLPLLAGPDGTAHVVVLAAEPGACDGLAEAAARGAGAGLGPPVVDRDLDGPVPDPVTGLAELSRTHRAVGVLVDHGRTLAQACDEIARAAARSGTTRAEEAARVLRDPGSADGPREP